MRKLPVVPIRRNPTALPLTPNQIYDSPCPAPLKGALAIVTNVGRDAVDADSVQDERAASGRRNRVVLTPRRWRQASRSRPAGDSGKTARSLGRARYKP